MCKLWVQGPLVESRGEAPVGVQGAKPAEALRSWTFSKDEMHNERSQFSCKIKFYWEVYSPIINLLWDTRVKPLWGGRGEQGAKPPEALRSWTFSKDKMHYERIEFLCKIHFYWGVQSPIIELLWDIGVHLLWGGGRGEAPGSSEILDIFKGWNALWENSIFMQNSV